MGSSSEKLRWNVLALTLNVLWDQHALGFANR